MKATWVRSRLLTLKEFKTESAFKEHLTSEKDLTAIFKVNTMEQAFHSNKVFVYEMMHIEPVPVKRIMNTKSIGRGVLQTETALA